MARTNIDIDEEACALVMRQKGFTTKRDAVNYALRRAAIVPMTTDEILALEGSMPDFPKLEELRPTEDLRPW
ncbi:type II toxin-antitoxin system VapB family antitoxin [Pseudolysinimonas sp.]|jgi:Arc/MetJ family transcription regulator